MVQAETQLKSQLRRNLQNIDFLFGTHLQTNAAADVDEGDDDDDANGDGDTTKETMSIAAPSLLVCNRARWGGQREERCMKLEVEEEEEEEEGGGLSGYNADARNAVHC